LNALLAFSIVKKSRLLCPASGFGYLADGKRAPISASSQSRSARLAFMAGWHSPSSITDMKQ